MAELRANQINLNNFLDDQAQTTQRVLSNQAETESTNQQKFKKIDEEIKSTTNNLEKIFNEKVDDIRKVLKIRELIDFKMKQDVQFHSSKIVNCQILLLYF